MEKKTERTTAVWRDWGFSGISVFIHIFVSAENNLL